MQSRNIIIILLVAALVWSCTDKGDVRENEYFTEPHPVVIIPTYNEPASRASISSVLQEFYINAVSGSTNKGRNIKYSWNGTAWNSSSTVLWPGPDVAISFWALSQAFSNGDSISSLRMTSKDQYFTYAIDSLAPRDLIYGSTLNTTYNKAGGAVRINFYGALAYPYLKCKNGIENVTLIIKEVIVHNLSRAGKFTFNKTVNSSGTWTAINNITGSFKQVLETPITIPPDASASIQITDSWKWIPQKPTKWTTTDAVPVPIATADELHHSYVELKCQMIMNGGYVWGGAGGDAEYESVYIPFGSNFRTANYKNAITLTFTGGYMSDGKPVELRSADSFTLAEWVKEDVLVDPWEEEEPEDLIF